MNDKRHRLCVNARRINTPGAAVYGDVECSASTMHCHLTHASLNLDFVQHVS
jgi:hypothetical protein